LDVLSQGTREAVFLSLRLALAAAYARRGALLPLVLDDVLVNLDVKRAKMAAEVLRDFANAGHQMMLFTCHHHILRIFQAASVETRLLPVREGLDQSQWIELDEAKPPAPLPAQDDPGEEIAEIEEEEIEAEVEEEIEEESPEVVAEEPEEVEEPEEIAEPDEVAAAAEEEDEEPEEGLPYSLWEESELRLADEDADDELETLAVGASGRSSVRDRWWETDSA
jgi:outer membrane biosynthesis protein TonB